MKRFIFIIIIGVILLFINTKAGANSSSATQVITAKVAPIIGVNKCYSQDNNNDIIIKSNVNYNVIKLKKVVNLKGKKITVYIIVPTL
jgi:hypothetical protein